MLKPSTHCQPPEQGEPNFDVGPGEIARACDKFLGKHHASSDKPYHPTHKICAECSQVIEGKPLPCYDGVARCPQCREQFFVDNPQKLQL